MEQSSSKKKVYFASDMHFGSLYHDDPMEVERKFVRWLCSIEKDAQAIVLVGDIFDYWYEYKYVVPRGYTRVIGKLADLSDKGIEVVIFTGNHDIWIFDYLPQEIDCTIFKEPQHLEYLGATFLIAHGDEFIQDDKAYRLLQSIFRNQFIQRLYGAIHPRWTVGFAHRWALSSRKRGAQSGYPAYKGEEQEYLVQYAKKYLSEHPEGSAPDFFIFGHRHIPLDLPISQKSRLLILGDWIHFFSYAVWDGSEMSLRYFND